MPPPTRSLLFDFKISSAHEGASFCDSHLRSIAVAFTKDFSLHHVGSFSFIIVTVDLTSASKKGS